MATDALWVGGAGVSYTDVEDRKLIHAIFSDGRVEGLELSVGAGLSVTVAKGAAVIRDSTSTGSYLVVLDAATSCAVPANSANTAIYLTVDPTTAQPAVVAGPSVPTRPYFVLGSVTTAASTVTSTTFANRVLSDFTPAIGRYLKRAGDTVSGPLTLTSGASISQSGSFTLDNSGLQTDKGIKYGDAVYATRRAYSRHERTVSQNIRSGVWTALDYDETAIRVANDYSATDADFFRTNVWTVPVSGYYSITGRASWQNLGNAVAQGSRQSSVAILSATTGAVLRRIICQFFADSLLSDVTFGGPNYPDRTVTRTFVDQTAIWWENCIDLGINQKIRLEVLQGQPSTTISVLPGATGMVRLLQAD